MVGALRPALTARARAAGVNKSSDDDDERPDEADAPPACECVAIDDGPFGFGLANGMRATTAAPGAC